MTIEITDSVIAIWSIGLGNGNWMGVLARRADKLQFNYRFRWYRDDIIGPESKDVRNFYCVDISDPDKRKAIETIRELFETMLAKAPQQKGWELIRGARTLDEFMEVFTRMPGIHSRLAEPHEIISEVSQ